MHFEIRHVSNGVAGRIIGTPCFYYVNANGNYLYPDGSIQSGCHRSNSYHGWYPTKEAAQAAIDIYHKKEKNMRTPVTKSNLDDLVEGALVDLTTRDVKFTAYDVTLKLRSENPTSNIIHEVVRDRISNQYYNGDLRKVYERELVDLPGLNVHAFVYAPTGSDFSTYQPIVVAPSPTASVPASRVVINATFAQVVTN